MKFWTTDASSPDVLVVVDMIQCQECDRWLPPNNMELHLLYHKQQQQNTVSIIVKERQDDGIDISLPAFVMETIPCEDCQVLVPKNNWDIHRAHVCRGRTRDYEDAAALQGPIIMEQQPLSAAMSLEQGEETVECDACGISVPLQNFELHLARACRVGGNVAVLNPESSSRIVEEDSTSFQNDGSCAEENQIGDDNYSSNNTTEEWECPRCTFRNHEGRDSQSDWKCTMCNYSLAIDMDKEDASNQTAGNEKRQHQQQPQDPSRWQSFVSSWVPREYHTLLLDKDVIRSNTKKSKQERKLARKSSPVPSLSSLPPHQQPHPSQWEVRHRRNDYLSMIERKRQQYIRLLNSTRQRQQALRQKSTVTSSSGENSIAQEYCQDMSNVDDNSNSNSPPSSHNETGSQPPILDESHPDPQQGPQSQVSLSQQELLQATEQLCLQHLEQLRRTSLIQELAIDIELLGLPRWRRHLHHLLDLYQMASELFVDNIIWEVRMHFSYYATLEVMALLALKVWKEQIDTLTQCDTTCNVADGACTSALRKACRNDRDISIICQSVLPFLGRPQTRAMRSM